MGLQTEFDLADPCPARDVSDWRSRGACPVLWAISCQLRTLGSVAPSAESEIHLVLAGTPAHLVSWITKQALVGKGGATAFAAIPSVQSASALVVAVDPLMHRFAELAVHVVPDDADDLIEALMHIELAGVVGSAWFGSTGSYTADIALGLTARFRVLISEMDVGTSELHIAAMQPRRGLGWVPASTSAVSYIAAASLDKYMSEKGDDEQLYRLERIQSLFGLRSGELTQLLDVSREGLRKWYAGSPMAPERSKRINELFSLATWFESHIRPEALPAFVRKPIPALGGDSPLDWLRARRWRDLRRVYERLFSLETMR